MRLNNVHQHLLFACAICFLMVIPHTISAQSTLASYPNDLTGSTGTMDPGTIAKCNGSYYTFGTGGGGIKSADRKVWSGAGYNPAARQSWWSAHGGGCWACDVTYKNGTYYCYYSVSASMNFNSAIGLSTSPTLDPATCKWTDQGIIIDSTQAADGGKMVNVIDPSTFTDDDGKWYLSFGSFQNGCRIAEINPANGKLLSNPPHPTKITNHAGEASAIGHWKTYYYYAISQGKCCANMNSTYYITYGRATNVKGPYTNKSGGTMMTSSVEKLLNGSNNSSATSGVVAVGVGGFFYDGRNGLDTMFLNYMGYTAPGGGPQLYIKPCYADANGWLTMDPTKGTVMTRPTPTVGINSRDAMNSHTTCVSSTKVSFIAANSTKRVSKGTLYSITGKRVFRNAANKIPAGVYIEKQMFVK